ncbi:Protein maelstrom like protein [Myotis davidii]|uniref:Protein maelstrom homolog n=1 Tax=Myotis davidii TaxID=225400 RepID=L5LTW1_MYODS|nr:Protein maelstrom like protein [Myotis davidii]
MLHTHDRAPPPPPLAEGSYVSHFFFHQLGQCGCALRPDWPRAVELRAQAQPRLLRAGARRGRRWLVLTQVPRSLAAFAMPNRKATRNAYYFFVQEKIPELRRRGLPLLSQDEKEKYADMARAWRAAQGKESGPSEKQKPVCTPLRKPGMLVPKQNVSPPDMSSLSLKNDQALLGGIFYFLNIFSHGELPPHCEQRFLPCEIGCVKYSLQDGIIADFHSFISPGEIPRGFRFHCQAASDSSHKIPISNFESGCDQATVLQNLYRFIHPNPGKWPPVYCKSDDRARVNWCLKHMEKGLEIRQNLELLTVEDLVVGIYQQKFLKEPSKTWVRSLLDVAMWDYSSNTRASLQAGLRLGHLCCFAFWPLWARLAQQRALQRLRCKWHEENDILFCALAVCKKIAYCISNSLATLFGIQLTGAHVPLQDYEASNRVTPKMVILDAGRYQKLRFESSGFSHFNYSNQEPRSNTPTGDYPSGVKISGPNSSVRGRGITRLLERISGSSSSVPRFSSCDTALSPSLSPKGGYKSFSPLS